MGVYGVDNRERFDFGTLVVLSDAPFSIFMVFITAGPATDDAQRFLDISAVSCMGCVSFPGSYANALR